MGIVDKISSLDRNPAAPALHYNKKTEQKNFLGGVLGLVILVITAWLIISKGIDLLKKSELRLSTFARRDYSTVSIPREGVALGMARPEGEGENRTYVMVPYEEYARYGIVPMYARFRWLRNIEVEGKLGQNSMINQIRSAIMNRKKASLKAGQFDLEPMYPCNEDNRELLCPPNFTEYTLTCNSMAFFSESCRRLQEWYFYFDLCDKQVPGCNQTFTPGLVPFMFLKGNQLDVFNSTDRLFRQDSLVVNNQPRVQIETRRTFTYSVPVTKVLVTTDDSILPQALFSDINQTSTFMFPFQDITTEVNGGLYLGLVTFRLYKSSTAEEYYRSYTRVDGMLGQIFGLIGLISLLCTCLCAGYNRYLMNRHLQDSFDDSSERDRPSAHYLNFIRNQFRKVFNKKYAEPTITIDIAEIAAAVKSIAQQHGIDEKILIVQKKSEGDEQKQNRVSDSQQKQNKDSRLSEKVSQEDLTTEKCEKEQLKQSLLDSQNKSEKE